MIQGSCVCSWPAGLCGIRWSPLSPWSFTWRMVACAGHMYYRRILPPCSISYRRWSERSLTWRATTAVASCATSNNISKEDKHSHHLTFTFCYVIHDICCQLYIEWYWFIMSLRMTGAYVVSFGDFMQMACFISAISIKLPFLLVFCTCP